LSKSELIVKILDNKYLRFLIPYINKLILYIKGLKTVELMYNKGEKLWYHIEKNKTFIIDSFPYINTNIDLLLRTLKDICCLRYLPQVGDIVIDIGAGIGTETIIFHHLVGDGIVYAVEAHPETFRKLNLLCKINSLRNVKAFNIAISNVNGSVFIDNNSNHVSNRITNDNKGLLVNSVTLDRFVLKNNISKINFLKMNIEGAEELAIDGMTDSVNIIENIAISCHDFLFENQNKKIRKKIINFLEENNFEVSFSDSPHYVRNSWVYGKKTKI